MNRLFPQHPCVLALVDNPFRCDWPDRASLDRCSICRAGMRDDVWQALMEGDRSFARFALADDLLVRHGFRVDGYQGDASHDSVFALVRSNTGLFVDPGDCAIVPIARGGYRISMTLDDESDYAAECDDLTQAWLLFRRLP